MKPGDIALANSKKGFFPQAIKWFTKSEFSHSVVIMPDILGTPMCMEAADNGVDMLRFDTGYIENPDQGYEIWTIDLPQEKKDLALKSILNELEILYGFLQYPWFIWRKLCLFFGKDIKAQNNWSHDGMICSQLVVAYLKALELEHVLIGYGNGSISQQDLKDIFIKYPDLFKLIDKKS